MMPRRRFCIPPESRSQLVELVRAGRSPEREWLLCVAATRALAAGAAGCALVPRDSGQPGPVRWHVWRPARARRSPRGRACREPETRRPLDARRRLSRRASAARRVHDPAGARRGASAGSRAARLHSHDAESALGRRYHLRADDGGLSLPRRRARRLQPADRRLGDGATSSARSLCSTRGRWRPRSAGPPRSCITAIGAASTRRSPSVSGAPSSACGRHAGPSGTAMTTRWPKTFSPHSNASSSPATTSPRGPRPGSPSFASSKAGMIRTAGTPRSASSRPSPTST